MFHMSNLTFASEQVHTGVQSVSFIVLMGLVLVIGIAQSIIVIFMNRVFLEKMKQNLYKRKDNLTKLIVEFKQAATQAEHLITTGITADLHDLFPDDDVFMHELISISNTHKNELNKPAGTPVKVRSTKALVEHAQEFIAIITNAREALREVLERAKAEGQARIAAVASKDDTKAELIYIHDKDLLDSFDEKEVFIPEFQDEEKGSVCS